VRGPATGLLIATVFVAGIGVGRFAPSVDGGSAAPAASPDAAAGPTGDSIDDFGLIREAWDLLHEKYVGRDTLDDRELAYGAIDGLTEAVGDTGHTDFMTPRSAPRATTRYRVRMSGSASSSTPPRPASLAS
jgi:hypothetical protein